MLQKIIPIIIVIIIIALIILRFVIWKFCNNYLAMMIHFYWASVHWKLWSNLRSICSKCRLQHTLDHIQRVSNWTNECHQGVCNSPCNKTASMFFTALTSEVTLLQPEILCSVLNNPKSNSLTPPIRQCFPLNDELCGWGWVWKGIGWRWGWGGMELWLRCFLLRDF